MAESKRRPWWRRLLRLLLKTLLWSALGSVLLVLLFRFLPLPTSAVMIAEAVDRRAWPDYQWRSIEQIAPEAALAAIAAEDQKFFAHYGFDLDAIKHAYARNQKGRGPVRGASTITQQVAKNVFLWQGRSWLRKGLEVWFTGWIELLWSKQRIIEVYLNVAEFGEGTYGVGAAAPKYFKRDARDLNAAQAARLAAVLPNPKKYSAAKPGTYVLRRQAWIQRQMNQLGGRAFLESGYQAKNSKNPASR